MTRVRDMIERSRRSLQDGTARQRLEGSTKQLLQKSRETMANFVGQPPPPSASQEVLAGVCSSVALRDLNLVDSLLEELEQMEATEDDPDSLSRLYRLDHLATRLRRNGENLRVLAGRDAGGSNAETSALVDVIRAGMSSIEHYNRVELGRIASLGVVGFAADDVSRLLAELLDNATTHSPPSSSVTVSAHLTEQGSMMIRVEDAGIGLPAARLAVLNERLASAPVLDRDAVRHMGLAVVRRLASRHGIGVWLARRAPHGTTASVLLPPSIVREDQGTRGRVNLSQGSSAAAPAAPPEPPPRFGPASRDDPATGQHDAEQQSSSGRHEAGTAPAAGAGSAAGRSEQVSGSLPSTTANGLPRRVSRSLKESSVTWPPPTFDSGESAEQDDQDGHEQLLADLGAFTEGEQAARDSKNDHTEAAEGPEQ